MNRVEDQPTTDTNLLGELTEADRRRAYVAALSTLHDPDDAEDCAQQALLNAWLKSHQFNNQNRGAYFGAIGANYAISMIRRQQRRLQDPLNDECDTLIQDDPNADPEKAFLRAEHAEVIVEAIKQLPSEQQAVVIKKGISELDDQETAQALDIPTGTAKSRFSRARAKLRSDLEPYIKRGEPINTRRIPLSRIGRKATQRYNPA